MLLNITHRTDYIYATAAHYCVQALWLQPRSGTAQTVLDWQIKLPGTLYRQRDGFGNEMASWTHAGPSQGFSIVAQGQVQTHGVSTIVDDVQACHPWLYLRNTPLAESHERLRKFGRACVPEQWHEQHLLDLAQAVSQRVRYRPQSTHVETTALEAFDWEAGVCQDQAHAMIAICRSLGIPARYVSGYFFAENEPDLASHAWVDICLNPLEKRWLSVDVTHSCLSDERHVRLAVGTDYAACPPIKGIRHGGGPERMKVQVQIQALAASDPSPL